MASRTGRAQLARVAALRYWRAGDAQVALDAWRHSGETLSGFARRHGIEPRRLRRWAAELDAEQGAVAFHPVQLMEREDHERRASEPIEIVTKRGHRVRVPAGFAAEDLERVLSVLAVGA